MVRLVYTFALVAALSLGGLFTSSASAGNGFGSSQFKGSGGQFKGSGGQFSGNRNFNNVKFNGNGFGNGFNGNGFNGNFQPFHHHHHNGGVFIFIPGRGFVFVR